MDPFASALDALFRAPGSAAAVYTDLGGAETPVRVIRVQPTTDMVLNGAVIVADTDVVQIQRSRLAEPVRRAVVTIGDFLVVGTDSPGFRIVGEPRLDVEAMTWTCEIEPA